MKINCTLDSLMIPALPTYDNEFGTKKQQGGLSTAECADDAMLPFRKMRPYEIVEDSETSEIQHNAVFVVKASDITLTLHDCSESFLGCEVRVINVSSGDITVKGGVSGIDGGTKGITVPAKREIHLIFLSDGWNSSYGMYCNITSKELSDSAVITSKIEDSNITTEKIADSAVTQEKIESSVTIKNPNALTVNGKTYDGSSEVKVGTIGIAYGGTGQTTQADINKAFVEELSEATDDVTDGTMFVSSYASNNGFADTNAKNVPYKRRFSAVWNYIKGKISSVLGLTATAYGGKSMLAERSDYANSDGNGNNIANTYATKTSLSEGLSSKSNTGHTHDYIPLSGSSAITGNLEFSNSGTDDRGIIGIVGDNDFWRIVGRAESYNYGALEIATADDGTEPIYVRQYKGRFGSLVRTATLLDKDGNTSFPRKLSSGPLYCPSIHLNQGGVIQTGSVMPWVGSNASRLTYIMFDGNTGDTVSLSANSNISLWAGNGIVEIEASSVQIKGKSAVSGSLEGNTLTLTLN
jgi:hypothetical protein